MSGLRILIPGSGGGTGPVIPDPLHSAGVDGWDHRYVASRIALADAAPVPSWADQALTGVLPLVPVGTASVEGRVTKGIESMLHFVRLTSLLSATTTMIKTGQVSMGRPRTIAFMVRLSASAGTSIFWQGDGSTLQYNSNGNVNFVGRGTGAVTGSLTSPLVNRNLWHLIIANIDTAGPMYSRDGVEATGTAPTLGPDDPFKLLVSGVSTSGLLYDFAEIIEWPFATTPTQRAAIYAALKAHYPIIP